MLWQLYIFALRRTQRHCLSATQHVINTWMTEESCWSNQLQSRHEGLVHIQKSYFAPSRLVRGEPTALNLQVWVYHYKFGTPRGELQYFYPHRPSCTGYLVQDFPRLDEKVQCFPNPEVTFWPLSAQSVSVFNEQALIVNYKSECMMIPSHPYSRRPKILGRKPATELVRSRRLVPS